MFWCKPFIKISRTFLENTTEGIFCTICLTIFVWYGSEYLIVFPFGFWFIEVMGTKKFQTHVNLSCHCKTWVWTPIILEEAQPHRRVSGRVTSPTATAGSPQQSATLHAAQTDLGFNKPYLACEQVEGREGCLTFLYGCRAQQLTHTAHKWMHTALSAQLTGTGGATSTNSHHEEQVVHLVFLALYGIFVFELNKNI